MLLIFPLLVSAQPGHSTIYKMDMDVRIAKQDTTYCYSKSEVIWGFWGNYDTLGFLIESEKQIIFYQISYKKLSRKDKKDYRALQNTLGSTRRGETKLLYQDYNNDMYYITILQGNSLIIMISKVKNLKATVPAYLFLFSNEINLCQN